MWSGVILIGTSIPGNALRAAPAIPGADKLMHAVFYGILGWLCAIAADGSRAAFLIALWLGIAVFAGADEWHQRWIPGRSPDWFDWIADIVSAGAAILLFNVASARRERIA